MNRWRNYALWAALLAFVPVLFDALGTYDIDLILPDNYETLTKAALGILVLAGIINNPTTKTRGFKDDK